MRTGNKEHLGDWNAWITTITFDSLDHWRLQSMIHKQKTRVDLQSSNLLKRCGTYLSIQPLKGAQGQHPPPNSPTIFYCNTKYPSILILRGAFLELWSVTLTLKLLYTAVLKRQINPLPTELPFKTVEYTGIEYAISTKAILFICIDLCLFVCVRNKMTASLTLAWGHWLYSYMEDCVGQSPNFL